MVFLDYKICLRYTILDRNPRYITPRITQKQVMDQCVLPTMTCGCQAWSLYKQLTNKLRTAQRAMERKVLNLKLQDKVPYSDIGKEQR